MPVDGNTKISEMPLADTLDGTEDVPILQSGINKRTPIGAIASPILQQDLTVNVGSGQAVGGSQTGELFPKGATLESVLRDILIKAVHPTYVSPTVTLSSNDSVFKEETGTIINPAFTYSFSQNDSGGLTGISLKRNGTEIATVLPYTDTNYQITDSASYVLQASYSQGIIKNDNLGNPDATGRINAGTVNSNTITYTGYRKIFWGTSNVTPTTSANVRSFATGQMLSDGVNNNFTITIPQSSVTVWFAYPDTLADVSSVQYVEYSFSEVKTLFSQTIVSVTGNNNYSAINYKVFSYTPLEPFQTTIHYKVIL